MKQLSQLEAIDLERTNTMKKDLLKKEFFNWFGRHQSLVMKNGKRRESTKEEVDEWIQYGHDWWKWIEENFTTQ